ncbi:amidohydrolase family protein [Galbibacter pacificus]|uniref:Amidohydrolase family protein n=1 Tax=Galbibacter pacificus TaxID=2996052 RepID=A0ABT6FPK6_9FLAO|nr:amidohydrolase family protein [Galbibacter pacificus]MDG3582326.1 amidohydrolase family protein [Galbibacter pacificus]MDG3585198.1 amidohydrolase family protein [Galbibacter pacificus]
MQIDSHQHFWQFNPVRDAWITDAMKEIRRDFMPADLKDVLEQNNMDGCVAVQADQSEEETDFLLKLAEEHNFIKGVVGWVDLLAENVEERLLHFTSYKKFKGVRHIVQAEPMGFMEQSNFRRGIKALGKYNLSYDILIKPWQLNEAINLVRSFPRQKFVLDHMAKPAVSNGMDTQWKDAITGLAMHKNVSCKVSGLVTEAENFKWNGQDLTAFLEVATNAFGTERLLFGSDWPVCLVAAQYKEVKEIMTNYFKGNQLERVMGTNAIQFYNIDN